MNQFRSSEIATQDLYMEGIFEIMKNVKIIYF